jgi:hypothetical protein
MAPIALVLLMNIYGSKSDRSSPQKGAGREVS